MSGCFGRREPVKCALFDPEKGKTTNKFVTGLLKAAGGYGMQLKVLDSSSRQETVSELPLVLIVRSTTSRYSEDLQDDVMDEIESNIQKRPDIILYVFHNGNVKTFSKKTDKVMLGKQYSTVKIIAMDFCEDSLCKRWRTWKRLKKINRNAFKELKLTALEIKRTTEKVNFEHKLLICDKYRSTLSRTIIGKLQYLMAGSVEIEKTEDLKFDVPQAVISKNDVGIFNGVKECDLSGIILICLRVDQGSEAEMSDKRIERIDIDTRDRDAFSITLVIAEELRRFVQSFYERKHQRRSVQTENSRTDDDTGIEVSKVNERIDDVDERETGTKQTNANETEQGSTIHE